MATENVIVKFCAVTVATLLVIGTIIYTRKTAFDILFREDHIKVKYVFDGREERFNYEDLVQLDYISVHESRTTNRLKFKVGEHSKTLRFKTVAYSDAFIKFVKWLKNKNETIEIKVTSSDHYLNHLLHEEYGFNYRKVRKVK